ncbi:hypothetical protein [Nostoc phage Nsp-JY10]
MCEGRKLQQGQAAQPQNRLPPRHKQPPRVRAQGCDPQEKGPERTAHPMRSAIRDGKAAQIGEAQRSGQLARLTEEIRAPGRRSSCCGSGSSDGGGWPPPQQPCSQHLYNAGQVRLPGGQGLEDACQPGRRRANARGVRGARSFGGLHDFRNQIGSIDAQPRKALLMQVVEPYRPVADLNNALDNMSIRPVLASLVSLISASTVEGEQTCCLRHAQPFRQSPAFHIHAPYSANR